MTPVRLEAAGQQVFAVGLVLAVLVHSSISPFASRHVVMTDQTWPM